VEPIMEMLQNKNRVITEHFFRIKFNFYIIKIEFNNMKGLIIYIPENRFNIIRQILYENKVEGISYFNIMGQGELERKFNERPIEYKTQEKYVPGFARRTRVETIVPDSKVNEIIDSIKKSGSFQGKIFICDISESFDI
jgi:nitrogen regulatory protein P-II 1